MRKSRSKQRREAAASPAIHKIAPSPPSPVPSQRGTFRVAKALRRAASDLPGVVRNRQAEREAAKPRLSLDQEAPAQTEVRSPAKASVSPTLVRGDRPTLESAKSCKSRPSAKAAKSGDGGSRSFVPWC